MNGHKKNKVIIIGGGIGGLAAAMALVQQNIEVLLLEQAEEIAEIGAGIQLGPNAYAALDSLGVGEAARARSVFVDCLTMKDAVDNHVIGSMEVGDAFRQRFGNPYGVIHRADIHLSILEAVEDHPLIEFRTSTRIETVDETENGVTVIDTQGNQYHADAVIGADGGRSVVRQKYLADPPRVTGHVVYRAVVEEEDMPEDMRINGPVLWAAPHGHLVHYPLRGGKQYNLVVTFHSREQEEWSVREGSKEEVLSYFEEIDASPRRLLSLPKSWKRWATADRNPVEYWGTGLTTLLGDAAHPMTQYLAQGACMALEDAVVLGQCLKIKQGDFSAAFRLYEQIRIPRTARVVLSAREMGRLYHAKGVERLVRNQLWKGRSQERFYDAVEWLYSWNVDNCLDM
ncbi:3-hydroxybenzoate 6-monooxygenase [Vibrio cincinnatiensis]|jgi:salicylate hydroxylase|uniref:3-hydroxybenzoate 6-hydroxylase n=1 Tax=Vibrio cincinnatiensis DSM 19608 TaxID=1123491 RepID=A0A1T4RZW4_VIBCI|nr:3-hydroxybenzoate 6-monooxygenase [Vibrio cincinnatiensis]MCG3723180.1 3-hydroxybenzoate 6-monooxygenase [Vibrio cincinnatiensis]MCG3726161.1 3-hydroxybenzoate 6-monooxygenase [Vibrio cincinnatiensis]MCG3736638.1 3-hydroxybenzoate 6-monooxygenase [Vibrio cincinnatiensis]MCG3747110.1 3-hydroxybenzoate 6-monooxygenase [Vibrio cincinnatiensis]MCG3765084.1 3-hydroxybenzoate 6-monooxygenase [Vibrio cincinnatiensis]